MTPDFQEPQDPLIFPSRESSPSEQHLEFLISQYVDGTLDASLVRSLEQQLAQSPKARQLLAQHREIQGLLEDVGHRLPLIRWDQFDQQLMERLEALEPTPVVYRPWWRHARSLAVAAGLLLVAGITYLALPQTSPQAAPMAQSPASGTPVAAMARVQIEGPVSGTQASLRNVRVVEAAPSALPDGQNVQVFAASETTHPIQTAVAPSSTSAYASQNTAPANADPSGF